MSRTIDRQETLKRMEKALSRADLMNEEPVDLSSMDDHDLIMCSGTLLEMARKGHDIDLNDFLSEIRNRAKRYVTEMLMREGLLVFKEGQHGKDN